MNTKTVEESLLRTLEENMAAYKARKKDLTLVCRSKEVIKLVQLIIVDKGGEWSVAPRAYLIHKELEKLYHKVIEDNDETVSVGNSFEKIFAGIDSVKEGMQFEYSISTEADIERVAKAIEQQYAHIDKEYLERFLDVAEISKALNAIPDKLSFHFEFNPVRCAKGILASYLSNEERLDSLISVYRSQMEVATSRYKREFEACVNYVSE